MTVVTKNEFRLYSIEDALILQQYFRIYCFFTIFNIYLTNNSSDDDLNYELGDVDCEDGLVGDEDELLLSDDGEFFFFNILLLVGVFLINWPQNILWK